MMHRIPVNNFSSLWKRPVESPQVEREAGRDFWERRFKPLNCFNIGFRNEDYRCMTGSIRLSSETSLGNKITSGSGGIRLKAALADR